MSERGSFVTNYIYNSSDFNSVKHAVGKIQLFQTYVQPKSVFEDIYLPIVAGKFVGTVGQLRGCADDLCDILRDDIESEIVVVIIFDGVSPTRTATIRIHSNGVWSCNLDEGEIFHKY